MSTHHEELAKQWKHFETVLNCPESSVLHDFNADLTPEFKLDIRIAEETINEVQVAIREMKNNKTAWN